MYKNKFTRRSEKSLLLRRIHLFNFVHFTAFPGLLNFVWIHFFCHCSLIYQALVCCQKKSASQHTLQKRVGKQSEKTKRLQGGYLLQTRHMCGAKCKREWKNIFQKNRGEWRGKYQGSPLLRNHCTCDVQKRVGMGKRKNGEKYQAAICCETATCDGVRMSAKYL